MKNRSVQRINIVDVIRAVNYERIEKTGKQENTAVTRIEEDTMSFHFVVSILLFLRKGAHIVLAQDNFPVGIINSFETIRPTFLYASPFHYKLLAVHDNISPQLLSNVRIAVVQQYP